MDTIKAKQKIMETLEQILERVNNSISSPLVDSRFGDNWKESPVLQNMSPEVLIELAWSQGRKAILLERELEKLLILNK